MGLEHPGGTTPRGGDRPGGATGQERDQESCYVLLIQDRMRYEQQADGCAKDMLLGRGGKSLAMMIRAMHVVMYLVIWCA